MDEATQHIAIHSFKPAWWLANRHLQTIWGLLARRRLQVSLNKERIELPDGDFIDVAWLGQARINQPLIIILHGLGGSADSHYVRGLLTQIDALGWRAVVMHFRGASEEPNRLARSYHSGDTEDVDYLIRYIRAREPEIPLAAVGYSLGGNVLLKWLGEATRSYELRAAIAVSVPFDLAVAADTMSYGFARMYQWYLLHRLKQQLYIKFTKHIPASELPISLSALKKCSNFRDFDHQITAPLHGFTDAHDYYTRTSSRQYIKHITVPTLIIHAQDDPFMRSDVIPEAHELAPAVTLEITRAGGHVGFISGKLPGKPVYWLEQRIKSFLQATMPAMTPKE